VGSVVLVTLVLCGGGGDRVARMFCVGGGRGVSGVFCVLRVAPVADVLSVSLMAFVGHVLLVGYVLLALLAHLMNLSLHPPPPFLLLPCSLLSA